MKKAQAETIDERVSEALEQQDQVIQSATAAELHQNDAPVDRSSLSPILVFRRPLFDPPAVLLEGSYGQLYIEQNHGTKPVTPAEAVDFLSGVYNSWTPDQAASTSLHAPFLADFYAIIRDTLNGSPIRGGGSVPSPRITTPTFAYVLDELDLSVSKVEFAAEALLAFLIDRESQGAPEVVWPIVRELQRIKDKLIELHSSARGTSEQKGGAQ